MKYYFHIILLALLLSFVIPIFPCVEAATSTTPMMDIYSITGDIYIHKDGKADFDITIKPIYNERLNWDLSVKSLDSFTLSADGKRLKPKDYKLDKKQGFFKVISSKNVQASIWELNFTSSDMFFVTNRDNFKWYAISTNHSYIGQVYFNLKTEIPLPGNDRKSYRLYAFHGVGASNASMVNNNQVIFQGSFLTNNAGFSIFTSWPKGTIKFPFIKKLAYNTNDLPIIDWIIFGLILPLFAIILLIILFLRHKTHEIINSTNEIIDKPPTQLSPLQVGILVDKKIYAKTLMATIIDLCEKGYLVIVRKNNEYFFAKRQMPDKNLSFWESNLVEELTISNRILANEMEIKAQIDRNIFSPKIKASYEQAYLSITEMGYFSQNPHFVRVKYKIYAIILYLASIIGLIWVAITMQSSMLLIPLLGVLLSTMIVIKFAYLLPMQSQKGLQARKEWLRFRNYLKNEEPIPSVMAISGAFYQYLPYAIVLGVEKDWSERFHSTVMPKPNWLIDELDSDSDEANSTLHQVINIINNITVRISQLKGPSVK